MAAVPPPSTPRPDPEPEQPRSAASGFLTYQHGKIVKIWCFGHQVVWYFVPSQQITNTGLFVFPTATLTKGNPSPAPTPPTGRTHFLQRSPGHGLTALSIMTCRLTELVLAFLSLPSCQATPCEATAHPLLFRGTALQTPEVSDDACPRVLFRWLQESAGGAREKRHSLELRPQSFVHQPKRDWIQRGLGK